MRSFAVNVDDSGAMSVPLCDVLSLQDSANADIRNVKHERDTYRDNAEKENQTANELRRQRDYYRDQLGAVVDQKNATIDELRAQVNAASVNAFDIATLNSMHQRINKARKLTAQWLSFCDRAYPVTNDDLPILMSYILHGKIAAIKVRRDMRHNAGYAETLHASRDYVSALIDGTQIDTF